MTPEDPLVRFFFSLPEARRRAYEELAERDKRFGENVETELDSLARGELRPPRKKAP
jgi:hypothetical protein